MTYLEQVEPHLVHCDVLNGDLMQLEAPYPKECGRAFTYDDEKDINDKNVEWICEDIVGSMDGVANDYLVAFFHHRKARLINLSGCCEKTFGWKAIYY